jgi:hypothetical protein
MGADQSKPARPVPTPRAGKPTRVDVPKAAEPKVVVPQGGGESVRSAVGRGAATADLAGWMAKRAETREIPMLTTWVQLATLADVAAVLRAPRRVPFDAKRAEALQAAREFAEWMVERAAPIEIPGLVS